LTPFFAPISVYSLLFQPSFDTGTYSPSGSAWRGAFGHALRQMVCVTKQRECTGCSVLRSCLYTYIFESTPPEETEKMRRYRSVPHPYALSLPDSAPSPFVLNLTLFGHSNEFLPHVLHAFSRAGVGGVGSRQTVYTLLRVLQKSSLEQDEWVPIMEGNAPPRPLPPKNGMIPPCYDRVVVRLLSPLRLMVDSHLVSPRTFSFASFFMPLLRRLSMLAYFHGGQELSADFAGLAAQARKVAITRSAIEWEEGVRYSSRQKTPMNMGGIMGEFELSGVDLLPFWPFLWNGQWTQNGKLTTMGLGCYRIGKE